MPHNCPQKNSQEQSTKKLTKPASGHSFKWEWAGGAAGFNEESVIQSVQSLEIITALPLPLGHLASRITLLALGFGTWFPHGRLFSCMFYPGSCRKLWDAMLERNIKATIV